MKFKMKKLICCLDRKRARVGDEYYFFDDISRFIKDFTKGKKYFKQVQCRGILSSVSDDKNSLYPFCMVDTGEGEMTSMFIYKVRSK